jgi:Domain of unknown function (DUF5655)/Domain of unknown function (DUF4287)
MATKVSSMGSSLYSVHPGVAMVQKWIAELPQKTGRTLEEWVDLVKQTGPPTENERRAWLKEKHKLGTNSAWWIAERAGDKRSEEDSPEAYLRQAEVYVEEMFTGPKSHLRPLYNKVLRLALALGEDVKACPCKTIVPLYRKHVFAQIKPTTNSRIDLGLSLGRARTPKRLIDTGGLAKGDRITHRIPLSDAGELDSEVRRWLKTAYELDE